MTRDDALRAAIAVVDDLAPRKNARGFDDGTIRPGERVALVLRVADWLLTHQSSTPDDSDRKEPAWD